MSLVGNDGIVRDLMGKKIERDFEKIVLEVDENH
jgi:hypothetical protein